MPPSMMEQHSDVVEDIIKQSDGGNVKEKYCLQQLISIHKTGILDKYIEPQFTDVVTTNVKQENEFAQLHLTASKSTTKEKVLLAANIVASVLLIVAVGLLSGLTPGGLRWKFL